MTLREVALAGASGWAWCLRFLALVTLIACQATATFAAVEVTGKVTSLRGDDVTVTLSSEARISVGDQVVVSFRAGEDLIEVGEWRVTRVLNGRTVEATAVRADAEPNIGMEARVLATGGARSEGEKNTKGGADEREDASSADERFDLAFRLFAGKEVPKDIDRAIALIKEGADEGHAASMRAYGWFYDRGEAGFRQDYAEARRWYQKAADAGDDNAVWLLARLYADGNGVVQDFPRAVRMFETACGSGVSNACSDLGWHAYTGIVASKDLDAARKWWDKACGMGHPDACFNLGWMVYQGEAGPADRARGLQLMQKGCELGSQVGCKKVNELQ